MKKLLYIISPIFLVSCGLVSIQIAPARKERYEVNHPKFIETKFEEFKLVDKEALTFILDTSKFLVSWAPWCPYSMDLLEKTNNRAVNKKVDSLVFVCTSYDFKAIRKFQKKYPAIASKLNLIIDGSEMGEKEMDRMKSFSMLMVDSAVNKTPIIYKHTDSINYMISKKQLLEAL